jgi:hypothetical protein
MSSVVVLVIYISIEAKDFLFISIEAKDFLLQAPQKAW